MEQVPQKTWTMKHPAMAKAFAVMFAVMSVILIFGGVSGIGKAEDNNEERQRYEARYAERIENYDRLVKRLENSITYEEAWAELEKRIEQHDDDASQHRTDLAMNTAERGGYTMGADMIWEAMPEIEGARQELEQGKLQLAQGEAQMQQAQALYADNAREIERLASAAEDLIAKPSTAENAINGIYVAMGNIKQPPTPVEQKSQPDPLPNPAPDNPGDTQPEILTDPGEAATDEEKKAYNDSVTAHNEWPAKKEAYDAYCALKTEWDAYETNKTEYDKYLGEFGEYQAYLAGDEYKAHIAAVSTAIENAVAAVTAYGTKVQTVSEPAMEIFAAFGMGDAAAGGAGGSAGSMDFSSMTPEMMAAIPGMLRGQLTAISGGAKALADGLRQIGPGIEAGAAQLAAARAKLEAGEAQLKKAEHEVQAQLENIWYELEQLEEERSRLAENKKNLDDESQSLSRELLDAEELRELENDRTSAKLLLTSVKEVNDMVEAGGEIIPSAEKHLADYKAKTELQYKGRMLSCILAIVGGLAGLAGIPAVYEFTRRRAWLIAPVVLCTLLAAAAEGVYFYAMEEMWYVGLFTAIIALIHLVIVLPREKRPGA